MAIAAGAIWEVRTTGSDSQAGFYVSGGTDYSQQDSAQLTVTDCVTNGTTTVTSATGGFTSAMIGNGINVAGTIRQITAYTNTNTITVDALINSGTGQTAKVGGAMLSVGLTTANVTAGNTVYVKAGTYSISSATANASGGRINFTAGSGESRYIGYNTTRGDLTSGSQALTRPILQATVTMSGAYMVTLGSRGVHWIGIDVDGNSQATTQGIACTGADDVVRFTRVRRCVTRGITLSSQGSSALFCEVDGMGSGAGISLENAGNIAYGCYSHDNTGIGFQIASGSFTETVHCIAARNTTDGFQWAGLTGIAINCTSHGNTVGGFNCNTADLALAINCLSTSNGGKGFEINATRPKNKTLINCAHWNNTGVGVDTTDVPTEVGTIALSADPYTNASSSNFALNTTSGGGAACRAVGLPGLFPGGLSTGYLDIGAVQHADPEGGGGLVSPLASPLIRPARSA